ncbi:MAG: hypothetical protein WC365_01465 [Candidatus Babeliales bacterium]|jgi:hypothetical protein
MKVALGIVAIDTGQRPSTLLTWTEEEDWMARLLFDFDVINTYHTEENKEQKKAMKRR